jgi:transcriptional regulator with XRE-family HTH domain
MSRKSAIDRAYARKFGEKLREALSKARKRGTSVQSFADSLGVTRAGLHKYRKGKTVPGMEVIEKARQAWKIDVKYGDLDTAALFAAKPSVDDKQLLLPLAFEEITADHLQVEVGRKTSEYLQLSVKVFLSPKKLRA